MILIIFLTKSNVSRNTERFNASRNGKTASNVTQVLVTTLSREKLHIHVGYYTFYFAYFCLGTASLSCILWAILLLWIFGEECRRDIEFPTNCMGLRVEEIAICAC